MQFINTLIANKHTSIAAIVYLSAVVLSGLGSIWIPAHKDQFDQTANLIKSVAVSYGLVMAGDAKPQPK